MRIAVNASPLIFLAKLELLFLLGRHEVYTTNEVVEEVLHGLEKGSMEALLVKKYIDEGKIEITKVEGLDEHGDFGLHRGELATVLLAKKIKADKVIVDDYAAIKIAKYFGLSPMSTPFVLLDGVKGGVLSKAQFRKAMNKLISMNYWISPKLYLQILELAEKF